jgi:hypothetical protein
MIKIVTTILLVLIVAYGQSIGIRGQSETKNDWSRLEEANYSIEYPSSWELNQEGLNQTSFILFSALESDEDKFRENVNLLIQDLSGKNIDLDTYVDITEEQVKNMLPNSLLIESKRVVDDGKEFHKAVYSGVVGQVYLQFEQYFWVIGEAAYVLTFTTEKDKFEDFQETGERILNSFKLKD